MKIGALLLLLCACRTLPGERAQMGQCPSGEICTAAPDAGTFRGLAFETLAPTDSPFGIGGVWPLAVGSTMGVGVFEAELLGDGPSFTQPFDATLSGPALAVVAVAPPVVRVRAVAVGAALLRIVEPRTQKLYDRVELQAADVARMILLPITAASFIERPRPARPVVLWTGATARLIVVLEDAGFARLVDEGLALEGGRRQTWDTILVDGPTDFAATTSAGLAIAQRIETTPSVDDLVALAPLQLHGAAAACFRALSGGALVVGAPWRFAGPGVVPDQDCALVRGTGAIPVDVTVGDLSRRVVVTVNP